MSRYLGFCLFAVFLASPCHALKCYNASAMPDMMNLFMSMMFSGGAAKPSDADLHPPPTLPIDAPLLVDCMSCMRIVMRMHMNTSEMMGGSDTTTTTTTTEMPENANTTADPWDALSSMFMGMGMGMGGGMGGMPMPDMMLKMTFIMWTCQDNNNESAAMGQQFAGMLGGSMPPMFGGMPMMNEHNVSDSDEEHECVPMSMAMKIPGGRGFTRMCMCCKDECNKEEDCGLMDELAEIMPASHMARPATVGGVMVGEGLSRGAVTSSPEVAAETKHWSLRDKCLGLRTAAGFIEDVCKYVEEQPDTFITPE